MPLPVEDEEDSSVDENEYNEMYEYDAGTVFRTMSRNPSQVLDNVTTYHNNTRALDNSYIVVTNWDNTTLTFSMD